MSSAEHSLAPATPSRSSPPGLSCHSISDLPTHRAFPPSFHLFNKPFLTRSYVRGLILDTGIAVDPMIWALRETPSSGPYRDHQHPQMPPFKLSDPEGRTNGTAEGRMTRGAKAPRECGTQGTPTGPDCREHPSTDRARPNPCPEPLTGKPSGWQRPEARGRLEEHQEEEQLSRRPTAAGTAGKAARSRAGAPRGVRKTAFKGKDSQQNAQLASGDGQSLPLSCLHTPFNQLCPLTSSLAHTPAEILDFPLRDVTASQVVS